LECGDVAATGSSEGKAVPHRGTEDTEGWRVIQWQKRTAKAQRRKDAKEEHSIGEAILECSDASPLLMRGTMEATRRRISYGWAGSRRGDARGSDCEFRGKSGSHRGTEDTEGWRVMRVWMEAEEWRLMESNLIHAGEQRPKPSTMDEAARRRKGERGVRPAWR
jgi:hypothetical protein